MVTRSTLARTKSMTKYMTSQSLGRSSTRIPPTPSQTTQNSTRNGTSLLLKPMWFAFAISPGGLATILKGLFPYPLEIEKKQQWRVYAAQMMLVMNQARIGAFIASCINE